MAAEVEQAETEGDRERAFKRFKIFSPFIRYIMYRDVQLWQPWLPQSYHVGAGAEGVLREVAGAEGFAEKRLERLTRRLEKVLPAEARKLLPAGVTPQVVEHWCCELRRYRRRRGRLRKAGREEVRHRQEVRIRRVKQTWRLLGFQGWPAASKGSIVR